MVKVSVAGDWSAGNIESLADKMQIICLIETLLLPPPMPPSPHLQVYIYGVEVGAVARKF